MYRALLLSLCLAILSFNGGSRAAVIDSTIVERVAERIRAALPGYDVKVVDPLTLSLHKHSRSADEGMQINVDRIADFCSRTPDGCAGEILDFVGKIVPVIKAHDVGPAIGALRAVVRPAGYVDQLTEMMKTNTDHPVSAPVAGDIVMLCYFDMPTAMRPARMSELPALGLSREQALEVCRHNSRAALPPLPTKPPGSSSNGTGEIGYLKGDPYDSSYLLLHDDWAPMAGKLGGHLLVAVPDADLILFAEDTGPASSEALSATAKKAYGEAERPISSRVYRWTQSGWEVAAP
jgi:hypothetical protein